MHGLHTGRTGSPRAVLGARGPPTATHGRAGRAQGAGSASGMPAVRAAVPAARVMNEQYIHIYITLFILICCKILKFYVF